MTWKASLLVYVGATTFYAEEFAYEEDLLVLKSGNPSLRLSQIQPLPCKQL